MKRLLTCLMVLALFFPISTSATVVATGTVSLGNTGLSLVNGTAFVMLNVLGTGLNLAPYAAPGGHKITICSVTYPTQCAVGYIKAAGNSETLVSTGGPLNDGNVITNGTFDSDTAWTKNTGWTIGSGTLNVNISGWGNAHQDNISGIVLASLYKTTVDIVRNSGSGLFYWGNTNGTQFNSSGGKTDYYCASGGTYNYFYFGSSDFNGTVDNVVSKRVLTPSSTGVTISSTKGGEVYNWLTNTLTTGLNDAAGYSYVIENLGPSMLLGTGPGFTLGVGAGIQGP